ncbi:hypothetical protein TNCV_4440131 [Trichonephila clavipes]|nr:hypothetical protein TNCV_4440131 [Trichonephila clavipes]
MRTIPVKGTFEMHNPSSGGAMLLKLQNALASLPKGYYSRKDHLQVKRKYFSDNIMGIEGSLKLFSLSAAVLPAEDGDKSSSNFSDTLDERGFQDHIDPRLL